MMGNIAPEGFPQMGDKQMACVGLMADIEEGICALPEEVRELFWAVLEGDLNLFSALLKAPTLISTYTGAMKQSSLTLLEAIRKKQDK